MEPGESAPVRVGDILAGKYRVERVLGVGGMGAVVAATHLDLCELRAMKFMLPQLRTSTQAVERFLREARATVRLRGEHVVKIHDVGRFDTGEPYMVMEYLEGRDLAQILREDGPLPVVTAVDYVLQALEAVAEAHAAGIVHRDLKPGNLFLTRDVHGAPLVKVLDFGISKLTLGLAPVDGALTGSCAMFGSPFYMPPEQMRSARDVDARADIWAVGIILYQLLLGRVPFAGDSMPELCVAVLKDEPAPPSSQRQDIPRGLDAVLLGCIKKDREERFQSVAELAVALEPFGLPGAASAVDRICRLLGLSRSAATAGARAGEEEGEGLTARMRVKSHMATSPPASARGEWAARQSGEHPAPLSSPGTALAATGPLPTAVLPAAGPRPVPHVLQDEPTAPLPPGGLVLARGAVPAVVALAPAPPQPGLGPAALASQPGLALAALASQPGLGAGTAPPWGHTKPPGEQRARWASIAVGAAALFGLVAGGVALLVTGQRGGQSAGEPAATTGPASSQPSAAPEVARDKDPLPEEPDEPAAPPPTSETRAEPPQQPTAPTSGTSDESAKRRALEAKVWSGRASDDEIRRLRSICMRQGDVACRDRATAMLKQKSAAVADDENPFGGRH